MRSRRDSNPKPPAPEAGALSIELRKQNIRYGIILCPRQDSNLCAPGFNRKLYRLSYKGETCAPTRIRAGGRRARSSGGGTRTRDPGLMKPALYRLSYTRIHAANSAIALHDAASIIFVPAAGIEPATPVLSGQCSHLLSYAGKDENKIVEGVPHAAQT